MAKFYFCNDHDINCYTLDYWQDYMAVNELTTLVLKEAKIEYGNGYFFCTHFAECGDSNEGTCGKLCEAYKPRNGKSGRCKYSKNTYEETEVEKVLTREPVLV